MASVTLGQWDGRYQPGWDYTRRDVFEMANDALPGGRGFSINTPAWKAWLQEVANFMHTYWCVIYRVSLHPTHLHQRVHE